jgi:sterol desaturase/sphingolipid hydroxylase (fatty acid hydroxylase superfamily)
MATSADVVKASVAGFVASSWALFVSREHRLAGDVMRAPFVIKVASLSAVQWAAMLVGALSLASLVGFTGFAFVAGQSGGRVAARERGAAGAGAATSAAGAADKPAGPSRAVRAACLAASLLNVALAARMGWLRWSAQRGAPEWPATLGLLCGLGSVAVAQVVLIALHWVRRAGLLGDEWARSVQLKESQYSRPFLRDVVYHLSNPGAFLLMLPYLCLTWLLRLMPDSYYDYDAPVHWGTVLLQLLVVDLFTYCNHITEHTLPAFYKASHKPHHRFVVPQLFNAFDGSLVDTVALILLPLFATAQIVQAGTWDYVAFGTVYSSHFFLIHSEYINPLDDVLAWLAVSTASDHHVHHALFHYNFGHLFTVFDKLASTYRAPHDCPGFRAHALRRKLLDD